MYLLDVTMNKKFKVYLLITVTSVLVIFLVYTLSINNPKTLNVKLYPISELYDEHVLPLNTSKLFDINLEFVLNSKVCTNSSNILAVILVTSYFGNVETRSAMRRTFGMEQLNSLGLKRVFLLGLAPHDKFTSQNSIENENKRFGDIIQGNFIEAYRNLTYKHMMGLTWATRFCKNTKYIIKMDDDIVVNLVEFVKVLKTLKLPQNTFAGYILRGLQPIREPYNKWYVTKEEFSGNYYPTFVSGWFYVTSHVMVTKILYTQAVSGLKYFWIDDLFVTGILAQKLRVKHYDIGKFFAVHSEFIQCCISDIKMENLNCDFLIGPNGGDNNLFYTFNEAVKICETSNCHNRTKPINETCVAEKRMHLGRGSAVISSYSLH